MKVLLATLNAKFIHSSLALRTLRRFCATVSDGIVVREYTINNELLSILGDIFRVRPDVLGFACYIWNIDATLELAGLVRKVLPDTRIVLGGPEVTYDPASLLRDFPCVDCVVLGEGEESMAALLTALRNDGAITGIPGLACRQGGGEIVAGTPMVVAALDSLPFPYDDADMEEIGGRIVYYESSRGCPFACQYCLSSATAGVRFLSLERVFADLSFFIAHGVKQVKFVDRTFNARKEHYLPILRFLAAQETSTNFHFEIAADLLDEEVISLLRDVPHGRFQFEIGVQSTNLATLEEIRRKNDWPRIVSSVSAVRDAGNIHLHLDLIAGLPYEDYSRFAQSFNEVYGLRPHMLQLGFLKLLKGSGIRAKAAEHGYVFMDAAPYEVLANKFISYAEVRRLKVIEEVLGQTYNSGRFAVTLDWLVASLDGDAFRLYEEMAAYWEARDLHMASHSGKSLFRHINDFCRETSPERAADCREFLRFDALIGGAGTPKPEFLPWNGEEWAAAKTAFWRDEATVRKYLTDYRFTSWREVRNNYQLEVFPVDIPAWLETGDLYRRQTAVLFSGRPGDHRFQTAAPDDFSLEEEVQ